MKELQTWWAIPILTGGYSLVDIDPEVECGDIAFNRCSDVEADKAKDKAEITKLKNLLIIRDGGGHDVDCKSNYNRQCNCGHDSVEEYFNEVAK